MSDSLEPLSPSLCILLAENGENPLSPSLLGPAEEPGSPVPMLPSSDEDEWDPPVATTGWADLDARQPHRSPPPVAGEVETEEGGGACSSTTPSPCLSTTPLTLVNGVVVQLRRAGTSRASRAARPSEPNEESQGFVAAIIEQLEQSLRVQKRVRIQNGEAAKYRHMSGGSKGPGVRAAKVEDQAKTNHLASLKARGVDNDQEASYLLAGFLGEKCYDRLAEVALRTNAVHSSILKRRETQGAAYQTPRINAKAIGGAASAQCANVAVAMAVAEHFMKTRLDGVNVCSPLESTSRSLSTLIVSTPDQLDELCDMRARVPVMSTSQLVFNSVPAKLSAASIRDAAQRLANMELKKQAISERVASSNHMLTAICRSVAGGYEIDSIWAAIVLIVYLSSDPRGRPLLAQVGLTDLDLHTATTLEIYGRAEITRRARLRQNQERQSGTKGGHCAARDASNSKRDASAARQSVAQSDDDGVEDGVDDDNDEYDEASSTSGAVKRQTDQMHRTLATKRKRASKGSASANTADAHGTISWWFDALRSDLRFVLETLVAGSKAKAREAAQTTLERQAEGSNIASNRFLQQISSGMAVRSVEAMVPFVSRKRAEVPSIVRWPAEPGSAHNFNVGILRTQGAGGKSLLHACLIPERHFRPPTGTSIGVCHSVASQEASPKDAVRHTLPRLQETYALLGSSSGVDSVTKARLEREISTHAKYPLQTHVSGMTRSFICFRTNILVHDQTIRSAEQLATEAAELLTARGVVSESKKAEDRLEPYCWPCPAVGVGLRLNEQLRRWMVGRTRRNEPTKIPLVNTGSAEGSRDVPPTMDVEPLPLAIITDFKMRQNGEDVYGDRERFESNSCVQLSFDVDLHVCLDGATRVVELILMPEMRCEHVRALLYVAGSHSSYIGDVGSAISAGAANAAINSSKKVSCADVNTLPLLSAYDVYCGGLNNQHRAFQSTPYSGTYTSLVDTGVTPPGLSAHFYRSDRRHHGSMTFSEQAAGRISMRLAKSHYVPVGEHHYVQAPAATRGFPHGLIPGVHGALRHYVEALEETRELTGRAEAASTEGLFSLPFSPWTQALRPDVESTADSTLRHGFRVPEQLSVSTGRSYIPDSTAEDEAILTEPLFRRPCIASVGDNPWATAYEHMEGFFNASNTLAVIARKLLVHVKEADEKCLVGNYAVRDLWSYIDMYHGCGDYPDLAKGTELQFAADASVLLMGALYPATWEINLPMVPRGYAQAASRQARRVAEGKKCVPITKLGLELKDLEQCQRRWAAFRRTKGRCAWKDGIGPLIELLVDNNGSHNVEMTTTRSVRAAIERAVRAAWLVHSSDGASPPPEPCPAHRCATPDDVRRPIIDPIFVASDDLEVPARGALVGIKPHQLRQLYALLLGAHLPDVNVQVVRNEGGLSLRVSSAADILEFDGTMRSDKSVSATQTESDSAAFGSRQAKLMGCVTQRGAWDANALLLAPLIAPVDPPLPHSIRSRAEYGDASFAHARVHQEISEGGLPETILRARADLKHTALF